MIANSSSIGTDYQQYTQEDTILFKSYSYKDGKGQEKVYYAKDCVELSLNSFTISPDADNYEDIRNMLKAQSGGRIAAIGNKYFSETYEIMSDYYSGKLTRDEVKNMFKEYFYHACSVSTGTDTASVNQNYVKQYATSFLAGLYEYFSRANTRNACAQNMQEGKALMESHGLTWNGTYYYNSDWYYACEEMQEMFRETANELADEVGAEHVDFEYVEKNTRFTLDGGITFNGVWDSMEWQINYDRGVGGSFIDKDMAPPKDFVYCATAYWDGEIDLEKGKDHSFLLFLLAAVKNTDEKNSLLLDEKNYFQTGNWEKNDIYRSALAFLKNFNINWNFRSNRLEFLYVK